jgi:acyl carrier protein
MIEIRHDELIQNIRTTAKIPSKVLITSTSRFQDDLGVDSLDLVSVLLNIQDDYGVEWTDEEISGITTVSDILDGLKKRGVKLLAA